jgi:hypothetical protein
VVVVSGRAGWDTWGGCSDKRRLRNIASAAENRRRRRHVAVERAPESTAEYKWLSELFQSMILMAGDQE